MGEEGARPLTTGYPLPPLSPSDASGSSSDGDALELDLQSLLSGVVHRLREMVGVERALGWSLDASGRPTVTAAAYSGDPPPAPDLDAFALVSRLERASALVGPGVETGLRVVGEIHGCTAAVAVAPRGSGAPAILLLGGERSAGSSESTPPRPRILAALDAAAARLHSPFSAALALSRLRRLDAEMRRLDRLASLGTLAAEIAHEVRNPLVSVKTFMQLLPERRDDPELLTRFLDLAGDELRRMERLLDLVLDHARPPRDPGSEVAGLAAVIESVANLLAHRAAKAGISLRTRVDPALPGVKIAEDALRQVVLNLALNAIAVTPQGGGVELLGEASPGGIRLVVSDDGPGVPPNLRESLFEPFVSTRSDRAGGLGLSITRRIVEEAGGRIAVENREEGGARFCVELPAPR